ncbi:MAG: hypothetical protein U0176_17815 [Bacteroidia bacterium]
MKERDRVVRRPEVQSSGLLGDVSEQEANMTASAVPPAFSLAAGAAGGGGAPGDGDVFAPLGLVEADFLGLDRSLAERLAAVGGRFSQGAWQRLRGLFRDGGMESALATVLEAFYMDMAWVLSPEAEVLGMVEGLAYRTVAGWRDGCVEVVRYAGAVGMRAVVPYSGFGGNVILRPDGTATVVGRSVESVDREEFRSEMNQPRGTNYLRFQENMAVGKNVGGGDVLDVLDREWSWPLNNAWLQAAVDRRDPVRFVSDPSSPRTLFKGGGTIEDGLTVTGSELGVLLHRGFAPDLGSGMVRSRFEPGDRKVANYWRDAEADVVAGKRSDSRKASEIDHAAYEFFLNAGKGCARTAKTYTDPQGNVVEVQSNFFGGQPGLAAAA